MFYTYLSIETNSLINLIISNFLWESLSTVELLTDSIPKTICIKIGEKKNMWLLFLWRIFILNCVYPWEILLLFKLENVLLAVLLLLCDGEALLDVEVPLHLREQQVRHQEYLNEVLSYSIICFFFDMPTNRIIQKTT